MQISADISEGTKQLLERSLLHHIQALEALPTDVIIPPRLLVSAASGRKIARLIGKRRMPATELVELMRND